MKKQNHNKIIIILLVIFIILSLALGGFILYDKMIKNDSSNANNIVSNEKNKIKKEYKAYKTGDKVTIKLNNTLQQTFYVLEDSSSIDKNITLFSEKNIGTGAFNEDYSDGNEYSGSLIESKLKELTNTWENINSARLITIDEIKATGLTNKEQCGPSEDILCDTIVQDSWLLYQDEIYWTMTKATSDGNIQYDEGRYVYYISNGVIQGHIVGYKPGSEWNKNGTAFENFGIRPVIEISKEYIE